VELSLLLEELLELLGWLCVLTGLDVLLLLLLVEVRKMSRSSLPAVLRGRL
jgi:hypothetical protein